MTDPIYLDHNATTPLLPEVLDAMLPYLREHFGNPSSGHVFGERAHAAVERAREQVADLLGCRPEEVVFTSGGTEANNLAIWGAAQAAEESRRHIVTSSVEHAATEKPCACLEAQGWKVTRLKVDEKGCVDLGHAAEVIGDDVALVTVMHANNETGVIQPIAELAEFAREHGATVHSDAAQSLGKLEFGVDDIGVDLMSLAGHKLYAPKGVGALYIRQKTAIEPVLLGAGQERGMRPGTENVASIVGLGEACAIASRDAVQVARRVRELRDDMWRRLQRGIDGVAVTGDPDNCLPNTLNVRFPGVTGQALLQRAEGVAASTGSACHDGDVTPSQVLMTMGVPAEEAVGAVRLSLGRGTTAEEIERAAKALVEAWTALSSC